MANFVLPLPQKEITESTVGPTEGLEEGFVDVVGEFDSVGDAVVVENEPRTVPDERQNPTRKIALLLLKIMIGVVSYGL